MKKLIKTIATLFGIGYFPVAQGTLASLVGVGVYLLIYKEKPLYIVLSIVFIIVGFLVSGRAERIFGKKDSRKIVIDDFCGIFIVYLLLPVQPFHIIIGFILYRILDIIKIYPIYRLEKLPLGWGIMLDDLAAGIYSNIILQIIIHIVRH